MGDWWCMAFKFSSLHVSSKSKFMHTVVILNKYLCNFHTATCEWYAHAKLPRCVYRVTCSWESLLSLSLCFAWREGTWCSYWITRFFKIQWSSKARYCWIITHVPLEMLYDCQMMMILTMLILMWLRQHLLSYPHMKLKLETNQLHKLKVISDIHRSILLPTQLYIPLVIVWSWYSVAKTSPTNNVSVETSHFAGGSSNLVTVLHIIVMTIHWNLRVTAILGAVILSFIGRLTSKPHPSGWICWGVWLAGGWISDFMQTHSESTQDGANRLNERLIRL